MRIATIALAISLLQLQQQRCMDACQMDNFDIGFYLKNQHCACAYDRGTIEDILHHRVHIGPSTAVVPFKEESKARTPKFTFSAEEGFKEVE